MTKRPKTKKPGIVRKIIKHPMEPERPKSAADDLYREIRMENKLENEQGEKVKLKQGAHIQVIVEADDKETVTGNE